MQTPTQTPSSTSAPTSGISVEDIDPAVRAADDLFGHMNGGWLARTQIPPDRARYGTFVVLAEAAETHLRRIIEEAAAGDGAAGSTARKVGDLFTSFVDEARADELGVTPLAADLDAVRAVTDVDELLRTMGALQRNGSGGAVALFVNTDDRDSTRYVPYLEQSGLGLPNESYYREATHESLRTTYVEHVAAMLWLGGWAEDETAARSAAERVMALETRLAASHWDNVRTRDAEATYTKVDRQGLQQLAPGLPWSAWLAGLQAPESTLDDVVVREPDYLTGLAAALHEVDVADWRDWLAWHLVHDTAAYLSAPLVAESFDFYGRTLSGTPQPRERWKRGVTLVEQVLGEAAGQLYVERHFPPSAKARMVELVANIVEAYGRRIAALDWMGAETKARAAEKLAKFTPKIGYPDTWRDYSSLTIAADDLVGNVRAAAVFEHERDLAKLGSPVDRGEWFMTPQTVNAYFNPGLNEIVFPAAILQPPFFDVAADDAANYGGIGAVIGHEIGHGFDDQGSKYDGDGNLVSWWTHDDRDRFDERARALIEQYAAFEPRELPGHHVNGELTVGENIGDLGGVTIALEAYLIATDGAPPPVIDGLTGPQRFFAGWAQCWRLKARDAEALRLLAIDPHSPAEFRANVVRNVDAFYEAFGVREGDGLWLAPDQRVRIW
ncbi:MAG: peptidase M13 [Rhodoferax sp.]|nr:peptidase M13 [Actinomycetota bacterium]